MKCWYWLGGIGIFLVPVSPVFAQIIPDKTLPQNSVVTQQQNLLEITGGSQRGGNLFHSFEQFSVPSGGRAVFNNAVDIKNIITRVTGGFASNINGIIEANGTANLFLLNPQGIIFGPQASLNIGGSFLASTASELNFADGTKFSATNPQTSPLLTVSVPVGLQWGNSAKGIEINGANLAVQPGKTLAIAGGEIRLQGGSLKTQGGRIELAAVAKGALNFDESLAINNANLPTEFSDINLSGAAVEDTSGDKGGDIQVQGRRVILSEGSRIFSSTKSQPGGNLTVRGSELVELVGVENKNLFSDGLLTATTGAGKGGDLTIVTPSLIIRNGTTAATISSDSGKGGNLRVIASDSVQLLGNNTLENSVDISNIVHVTFPKSFNGLGSASLSGTGEGGDLTISTSRLILRDRAIAIVGTLSNGRAGSLTVNASEAIEMENGAALINGTMGQGNGGDINITTGSLRIVQRGGIIGGSNGVGNAGNLSINANQIFMKGAVIAGSTTGAGQAGNVTINSSEFIRLTDLAFIASQTEGIGNAGNITITTPQLIVEGRGAGVTTTTLGAGRGGDLTVNASDSVQLIGILPDAFNPTEQTVTSVLQSSTDRRNFIGLASANFTGTGNAGNLTINTGNLIIQNGAGVATASVGDGEGGRLIINALNGVKISGRGGLATASFGKGNAGNLIINTPVLTLENGGAISADTFGTGKGGLLTINSAKLTVLNGSRIGVSAGFNSTDNAGSLTINSEDLQLSGTAADGITRSGLFANNDGAGSAGNINLIVRNLTVSNGAEITVGAGPQSLGAGNINIRANLIRLDNGILAATTAAGEQGNIFLNSDSLQLLNNSNITTNATGTATGGNIFITTGTLAALNNSDITANAVASFGGKVTINTEGIFGTEYRNQLTPKSDITATSELGPSFSGFVTINIPNYDPTKGLLKLPQIFTSVPLPVNPCAISGNQIKLVNIGRGGLPPSPREIMNLNAIQVNSNLPFNPPPSPEIVEATGWELGENGKVILRDFSRGSQPNYGGCGFSIPNFNK